MKTKNEITPDAANAAAKIKELESIITDHKEQISVLQKGLEDYLTQIAEIIWGMKVGTRLSTVEGKRLIVEVVCGVEEAGAHFLKAVCLDANMQHGSKMRVLRNLSQWRVTSDAEAADIRKVIEASRNGGGAKKETVAPIATPVPAKKPIGVKPAKKVDAPDHDTRDEEVEDPVILKADAPESYNNLKKGQHVSVNDNGKWREGVITERIPKKKNQPVEYMVLIEGLKTPKKFCMNDMQVMVG